MSKASGIPGYTFGTESVPRSPVTLEDFDLLKKTVLFTEEDARLLRLSGQVLAPHREEILDTWYGFVGSNPHLVHYFTRMSDGRPDQDYLAAVRRRFGQWILDTCRADYGQAWLDYQHEIGLRHHRTKKNATDGADAPEHVPFRYLAALLYPIFATIKPFLERGGHDAATVEAMHQAWLKSVLLQVILWSHPYVRHGDF